MSALMKMKKKSKVKNIAVKENKKDVLSPVESPQAEKSGDENASQGSIISVREATPSDKQDNSIDKNPNDDGQRKDSRVSGSSNIQPKPLGTSSRPPSGTQHDSQPHSATSRPTSAGVPGPSHAPNGQQGETVQPIGLKSSKVAPSDRDMGSSASLKSRDNKNRSKPPTAVSNPPDEKALQRFAPPDMNEAHAYVPYLYARDCIAKMMDDMKKMKNNHIHLVDNIELNYRVIEDETQTQFNAFVISLRQNYGHKVKTFRQVIEVHRLELHQKQQYWDDALMSLSSRNKQLLKDKKKLLIQNKIDFDKLVNEKDGAVKYLAVKLDEANNEIVELKRLHKEELRNKEHEYEEEKDAELKKIEKILKQENEKEMKIIRDELETEKEENEKLRELIEELRNRPDAVTALPLAAAIASSEIRPTTAMPRNERRRPSMVSHSATVVITDLSEEERLKMEEERNIMRDERHQIKKERQQFEKDMQKFADDRQSFYQQKADMQDQINQANKDREIWHTKYVALSHKMEALLSLKAKYDLLKAKFDAAMVVASVNTDEEQELARSEIEKAESDKALMEEQKQELQKDIKNYEKSFKQEHGRSPTISDRSDSVAEFYHSYDEAGHMIYMLEAKIETIQILMKGGTPKPPEIKQEVKVTEPEVKVVEVPVPDSSLQAQLEMTQAELDALKRQVMALKTEQTKHQDAITSLNSDLSDAQHELTTLRDTRAELESKLGQMQDEIARLKLGKPGVSVTGDADLTLVFELEKKLQDRNNELQDAEIRHKEDLSDKHREHEKEKAATEKDMKKMQKEIDKLKKKLQGQDVEPDSDLEIQIETLEDKVIELELKVQDMTADRDHFTNISKTQKVWIGELENQLSTAEGKALQMQAAVAAGNAAQAQLMAAEEELDTLREKVKKLELEQAKLKDEMSKREKKQEKLKSDMEKDMKKMLKEIAQLRKQLQEKPETPPQPAKEEAKTDKLEDSIIDLEHKVGTLQADNDHLTTNNKDMKDRVNSLEKELSAAERKITTLNAAVAGMESIQLQLSEAQVMLDDFRQKTKNLEDAVREKEHQLLERDREHEHDLWQKEKTIKEMESDIKKLLKQMAKMKKQAKELEGYKTESAALKVELEALQGSETVVPAPDADKQKLQDKISELEEKIVALQTEKDHLKGANEACEARCADLEKRLQAGEVQIYQLQEGATAQAALEMAQTEIDALKAQIKALEEETRKRKQNLEEQEVALKVKDREMDRKDRDHQEALRDKDKTIKDMEKDMRKLLKHMAKLKEKLSAEGIEPVSLDKEIEKLEDKVADLEKKIIDLEGDKSNLESEKEKLENKNRDLEKELQKLREHTVVSPLAMSTPIPTTFTAASQDVEDLSQQIELLQQQVDEKEAELREERANHEETQSELASHAKDLEALQIELENTKQEAKVKLEATETQLNAEIDDLKKRLAEAEEQAENLDTARLSNLPPDTAKEIKELKAKLKNAEKDRNSLQKDKVELEAQIKILQAKIASVEKSTNREKTSNTDVENKLKQLRIEKDKEIKQTVAEANKKEKQRADQEHKKISALEQKIRDLEAGAAVVVGGRAKSATSGRVDPRALQNLQEKLRDAKKENAELKTNLRQLENESKKSGGSADVESARQLKKQEKLLKELEKILDMERKKNKKNEENNKKLDQDLKDSIKDNKEKENEISKLRVELAALGVSAAEAADLAKQIKILKTDVKKLGDENKTLTENYNSERVLRKKYYNMVEDMKGKIRVYCRVRPMSEDESKRGNHSVVKSPDEYTVLIDSSRGKKEFQFDTIFMPDSSQDKVFEDTNNLIQSAVDGYNVCIFAYGQTGSGKTFTIIGDRDQKLPGIAPRAFNRIFELIEENKSKFSFKVSCYMMELYNDKLLDLFSKADQVLNSDERLEIKKDKKGLVFVQGAEIKAARNAKELYALFEEGSKTRHTASTKMNAESSRSHLVISIIIESTNRTTGSVLKGKLSLVDLAGSERAAKTDASAQQLKEAMSINKSLSALGDVISALSSEQQFIPYRNNKLTMLMQDSIGGNSKTLMFVNISPADYNTDESVVSLTYASRVKLITNDAQKNADNKEINKLKNIIAKMKKGEAVGDEDAD